MGIRATFAADFAKFHSEVAKAERDLGGFEKALKKTGDQLAVVGKAATATLTVPIVALGAAALAVGIDFDKAMSTIAKGTGATGDVLKRFETSVRNVWGTVPEGVQTIARAMADLNTRLGLTDDSLESATRQMLDFSRVNNTDVSESVRSVSRLMNSMGVEADQLPSILDKLTAASQASGIGVNELTNLVTEAGPAFSEMGFGLDKSIALFAQFERAGANPREVVGSLNIALTRLAKSGSKDAEEAFTTLLRSIQDAPDILSATRIAAEAFGARVGGKIADDVRAGKFQVDAFMEVLRTSQGTLKNTADASRTFGEQLAQLREQVSKSIQPIGVELLGAVERLMPNIEAAARFVTRAVEAFSALPEPVKTATLVATGLVAALGPLAWGLSQVLLVGGKIVGTSLFATLAVGIKTTTGAAWASVPAFGAMWTAILGPVALIGGAIAAVALLGEKLSELAGVSERADLRQSRLADTVGQQTAREMRGLADVELPNVSSAFETLADRGIKPVEDGLAFLGREQEMFTRQTQATTTATKELAAATEDVIKGTRQVIPLMTRVRTEAATWLEVTQKLAPSLQGSGVEIRNLADGLDAQGRLIAYQLPLWDRLKPSIADAGNEIARMRKEIADASWMRTFSDAIARIPGLVQSAFTGGGGMGGALKGIASVFGEASLGKLFGAEGALGKGLAKLLPGAFAAAIPGIGAAVGSLVGPLVGKIGSLFSNKNKQQVKEYNAEIDKVRQSLLSQHGTLDQLEAKANAVGMSFRENWGHQGKAGLEEMNRLAAEFAERQNDLQAAIKKYGFSWEELGAQARGAHLAELGEELLRHFTALIGAGVDVNLVIERMGGNINEFIADALRTGTEIPIGMRPMLETMLEMGVLTDENGEALEDLSRLTWSESMTEGFRKVVDRLDLLLQGLGLIAPTLDAGVQAAANLAGALHQIPSVVEFEVHGRRTGVDLDTIGFSQGTKGRTGSWFADFGASTPTVLHGRQAVVREDQAAAFAADVAGRDNSDMAAEIAGLRADINALLPRAIGRAVRDAMQTSGAMA